MPEPYNRRMPAIDPFSGDIEKDWAALRTLWSRNPRVMMAEVGPKWEMPPEHRMCLDFAAHYPDSKPFLIGRLADPSPVIAAYAFKCLIRVADVHPDEVPKEVLSREEKIDILVHSRTETQTLAEFFREYFEIYTGRDEVLEEQKRTLDWQQNDLERYKRSTENPPT